MVADNLKIDLGEDEGFAEIVIGGKSIKFSPLEESSKLEAALPQAGEDGNVPTADVIRVMKARLKEEYGVEASPDMALAVYRAVIELNKRVAENFTKRLASQGLSGSTREANASAAEDSGECSPVSTDSMPSNQCDESPNTMLARNSELI